MKSRLTKLVLFSFSMLIILFLFGDQLTPILKIFGDPAKAYDFLFALFLITAVVAAGLIFVRTVLGILIVLAVAVVILLALWKGGLNLSEFLKF